MPVASPSRGRWTELYPLTRLPVAADVAVAIAATLFAAWARFLIADQLPPGFPFVTFFPVVIITAFVLGTRAGILTAIASGAASWYWFLPPVESWALDRNGMVAMAFYGFITTTEVTLVHWMQRSNGLLVIEREANGRLAETRELLFRELQHRVSNNLQMVAALLTVQRRQLSDEGAKAALDEAARRLQTIGKVSRQLYDPAGSGQKLDVFLDQLARDVIQSSTDQQIRHEVTGVAEAVISAESAIPLALVVAESIANAIEHGFEADQSDCFLQIRLQASPGTQFSVEIEDNGTGLPANFTLQGSDSLGLKIASMLATQLGGTYTLSPGAGRGALARLELPLAS